VQLTDIHVGTTESRASQAQGLAPAVWVADINNWAGGGRIETDARVGASEFLVLVHLGLCTGVPSSVYL
jgi:hypothetical protein